MIRLSRNVIALCTASMALTACGSTPYAGTSATAAGYPVSVSNCGSTVAVSAPPRRAVTNDVNTTEDMLALGLQSRMVGDFGVNEDGPRGKTVDARYLDAFHQVRDVSPSSFTLEPLLALRPDFLFAGWNYGLHTGTDLTPDGLSRHGISTLALTESCAHIQSSPSAVSIEETYTDLSNLGRVFNVTDRANALIAGMRAQVAQTRAKVAGQAPVSVFLYDSGEAAPFTSPGLAMPDALIELAGGHDIFASLPKTWTSVSWEQVTAADPSCVIINDYGSTTRQQKEQFLRTSPITKNLTAVRNNCLLPLAYDRLVPSPLNAEAVATIAKWLHPNAF
jgi:iron complex transport system substrate-binding protein